MKLDKFDIEIKEGFSELNQKIRAAYASHGDSMHPSNEPDEDPQYHANGCLPGKEKSGGRGGAGQ